MSRIGKSPISVPNGVEIKVEKGLVTVKGPKGELTQDIDPVITVEVDGDTVNVLRHTEQKSHKAKHGLYRSLIANMVQGVSEGFKTQQELVGVGYRANVQGQRLDLMVGYSHNIIFEIPKEVKVSAEAERGKNPIITLESHDKQLIGHIAAKIRSFRKPEPYKGKGIKFVGEQLRRKAGKSAAK
ncbi:MAG TPA: 50S ribosomal protein L6 [Vicingaceae bacterium]|jgi:large subunit ribosomal protein L6|nr:50S ribosomal protein L6 [Vicingaceae bacterium]